jgi:GH24 family phage-related lysozyme (muramidase)
MMPTTKALATFLLLREDLIKHAYDDKQPKVILTAETEIKGTITVGIGTTRYPDGSPVRWNDTVTRSEAMEYMQHYIRTEIEPALENLIHVQLAGCQYDALGSLIYQYGAAEVSSWRLIRRINAGEHWHDIAREWVNGTVFWENFGPAFWGRRIGELLMFMGLDWRMSPNIPYGGDVVDVIEQAGFEGKMPQPVGTSLFEDPDLAIPHPAAIIDATQDPTPDTPLTMQDLQYQGAVSAGYDGSFGDFTAHRTVVRQKDVVSVPNVDMSKPPKRMEDSKTHKGLSKAESGKEGVQVGAVVTGGATVLAAVEGGTSTAERTLNAADRANDLVFGLSSGDLITVGIVIGLPLILWGGWRWWAGKMIAYEGRQEGDQAKV